MIALARVARPFDESFARVSIAELRAAGYTDAIRYVVGAGKAMTLPEWQMFLAAGFSVTLIDEGPPQQALGGFAAGTDRARAAMIAMDTLGLPRSPEAACYYAGDDPSPIPAADYPTVAAFFDGVAAVHAAYGNRRIGDYGSAGQIDYTVAHVAAVTLEWPVRSWGLSRHPALIQEPNPTMSTIGGSVDQDSAALPDWGQWPPPPQQEVLTMGAAFHPSLVWRRDIVWPDTSWRLWHTWTNQTGGWMPPEDLAGFGYAASCGWRSDGHFFVWTDGVNGVGYERESDGVKWLTGWTPIPGMAPAVPIRGLPGPQGPTYDDAPVKELAGRVTAMGAAANPGS